MCLNILREDWKPVLNLNAVMTGLQYLFLEPNADDPLNKGQWCMTYGNSQRLTSLFHCSEAAEEMRRDRDQFLRNVRSTMRGGSLKGKRYDNVLASAQ